MYTKIVRINAIIYYLNLAVFNVSISNSPNNPLTATKRFYAMLDTRILIYLIRYVLNGAG
jgi:hypothetical protein